MITYASLFAGIGGFELGIQTADLNAKCVFASENNKYAKQIYKKNFGVEPYGDIREINTNDIPDHDILCAGFPCQAFSIAGQRRGFEDCRGTLFFEIMRIAKAKKPTILFLENVRGLLSHDKGKTFYTILRSMDDLGYDAEWQVFNSKNHGVPQNRERVFIIGHLRGRGIRQIFPVREKHGSVSEAGHGKDICAGTIETRNQSEQAQWDSGTTLISDSGLHRELQVRSIAPPLRANTGAGHDNIIVHEMAGCLTGGGHSGGHHSDMTILKTKYGARRLTPVECERLQGFPDNWTEGISDTQRYKCLGNAVTVNVVAFISSFLFDMMATEGVEKNKFKYQYNNV